MNHLKRSMLVCMLAIVLTTLLTAGMAQAAGQPGGRWSIVTSPNPGSNFNNLSAVAAVSATDIWAVGGYANLNGFEQTLIKHWNGTTWQVIPSPNPGSADNQLGGVAAVSATDIWAVGFSINFNGFAQTLIEHWNGSLGQ